MNTKHHFIATYFNICGYKIRQKLTQEFVVRYPRVHLIQVAYDDDPFEIETDNDTKLRLPREHVGFINMQLVNAYMKNVGYDNCETVTLIDSDLILEPLFFHKVITCHEQCKDVPAVIQCFKNSYELINGQLYYGEPSAASGGQHTGYVLSFNKKFLVENNFHFPQDFILGGYDYFLIRALIDGKNPVNHVKELEHLEIPQAKLLYVDTDVVHCSHGNKADRLTPWEKYEDLNNEGIVEYFVNRDEDREYVGNLC